jgi:hypothetical protein
MGVHLLTIIVIGLCKKVRSIESATTVARISDICKQAFRDAGILPLLLATINDDGRSLSIPFVPPSAEVNMAAFRVVSLSQDRTNTRHYRQRVLTAAIHVFHVTSNPCPMGCDSGYASSNESYDAGTPRLSSQGLPPLIPTTWVRNVFVSCRRRVLTVVSPLFEVASDFDLFPLSGDDETPNDDTSTPILDASHFTLLGPITGVGHSLLHMQTIIDHFLGRQIKRPQPDICLMDLAASDDLAAAVICVDSLAVQTLKALRPKTHAGPRHIRERREAWVTLECNLGHNHVVHDLRMQSIISTTCFPDDLTEESTRALDNCADLLEFARSVFWNTLKPNLNFLKSPITSSEQSSPSRSRQVMLNFVDWVQNYPLPMSRIMISFLESYCTGTIDLASRFIRRLITMR